jgi:ectoine hydroxylase-related dioxygenase (phytanoyl-CoA dioxygenase family)
MNKIKYFSPLRFVYGSLVVLSAIIKIFLARVLFSQVQKTFNDLDAQGFIYETHDKNPVNTNDILVLNEAFRVTKNLKSVKDGHFIDWTSDSNTHYLLPDLNAKKALVSILADTNIISRISAHHGFDFYCKAANIFKTKASEGEGTTSTNFHRDGHPPFTYKLMVYLTDVRQGSGPFAIMPGSLKRLIIPTFGSYNYERTFSDKNYDDFSLYGDAGTKILFQNNGLHAGGRTSIGERVVVTFILHPKFSSTLNNSTSSIDWSVGGREYGIL